MTAGQGGTYVGFRWDTTVAVARLAYPGMLARYPGTRWLIAHGWGAPPWLTAMVIPALAVAE